MKYYKFYFSEKQIKVLAEAILYAELYCNEFDIKVDLRVADELGLEFDAYYDLIQYRKTLPWYKRFFYRV